MLNKEQLGKELARLIREDMEGKGLNEYRIRQDKSLYPFTQSIVRQLERGEFSLKRIGEIEEYLGIKVFYVIEKI